MGKKVVLPPVDATPEELAKALFPPIPIQKPPASPDKNDSSGHGTPSGKEQGQKSDE